MKIKNLNAIIEKRNRYAKEALNAGSAIPEKEAEAALANISKSMQKENRYNKLGDANYYDEERLNSIVLYELVYGTLAVMYFCEINVLKYRLRIGKKMGQPMEQELLKAEWYERAAQFYYKRMRAGHARKGADNLISPTLVNRHVLPWDQVPDNQAAEK
jgi:hypothetical protein